jgi:hypothetical protein
VITPSVSWVPSMTRMPKVAGLSRIRLLCRMNAALQAEARQLSPATRTFVLFRKALWLRRKNNSDLPDSVCAILRARPPH